MEKSQQFSLLTSKNQEKIRLPAMWRLARVSRLRLRPGRTQRRFAAAPSVCLGDGPMEKLNSWDFK